MYIVYRETANHFFFPNGCRIKIFFLLCKYTISAHSFNVDNGRYKNLPISDRKITSCNSQEI